MRTYPYDNTGVTVELREIVESGVDVWRFDYPSFYTGEAKAAFEKKVLDHYWFRQIGQETVGRWLHCFRTRMQEIMPYYIQLYESEKYMQNIEDPFATVDYTETYDEERTGEATSSMTSTGLVSDLRKFSNTPQGRIENLEDYMTEATVDNSNTEASGESTGTESGTVRHTLHKKGAMGVTTFGHDMIEYRESFLNIDLMVIKELNDLFLGVY